MWNILLQVSLSQPLANIKDTFASIPSHIVVQCWCTFCKCYRRQRIFPKNSEKIPHLEEELALNDADPNNAVSKKCKHGVKTLVDTIVDQPCQYGNVVIYVKAKRGTSTILTLLYWQEG